MKIGLFHSSLPSETFILWKIRSLIREGYQVQVFLANASNKKTDFLYVNPYPRYGLPLVLFFPFVIAFIIFFRPRVALKFWNKERGDGKGLFNCLKSIYINAHILQAKKLNWLHFTFSTFAIGRENVAASIGARLAISFRGFDVGVYPLKHQGCFSKLWRVVDKVHTISDDLYQLALDQGLSPKLPMQKIRPAILTDKLKVKDELGSIKAECSIISIGRLEWKKGFIYALHAMHFLKQRGIKFTYKIAGSGAMEEALRYAIYDLQLEDSVQLIGQLQHDQILNFLCEADIYIQPSVQEGFCNALLEAQGSGLLCVASDAEGLSENVLHNRTGWIIPKRDAKALAEKLEEIISMNFEKREMFAKAALKRVNEEFRIDRLVAEFKLFYSLN